MNQKTKTKDPEVRNFQYALKLAGISTADSTAHHVMAIHNKILEKGDDFNLRDSAAIEAVMNELYPEDEKEKKEEEVSEEASA